MIITISGDAGTGKTTIAKRLSEELHVPYFYAGAIFRDIAKEKNLSVTELSQNTQITPDIDRSIDNKMIEILQKTKDGIVEGRLSGYLAWKYKIPSIRIFLKASPLIQAERIANREGYSVAEGLAEVETRDQKDWERYKTLYDINKTDELSWHTAIIDTDELDIEGVYNAVKKIVNPKSSMVNENKQKQN
jgi:predicted cytidylate kinase